MNGLELQERGIVCYLAIYMFYCNLHGGCAFHYIQYLLRSLKNQYSLESTRIVSPASNCVEQAKRRFVHTTYYRHNEEQVSRIWLRFVVKGLLRYSQV